MTVTGAALGLAGLGLLLSRPPDPGRARLGWLARTRWPGEVVPADPADQGARLPVVRRALARWPWPYRAAGAALLAGGVTGLLAGPVPAALAATSAGTLAWCRRVQAGEAAEQRARTELAAAIAALAEEYAAGATVGAAFARAAPVAGNHRAALLAAAELADRGDRPELALQGSDALASLAIGCRLANRSGASFAGMLAGLRRDLAAGQAAHAALRAAVAGPRSSALLLAGLPALGLVMGAGMGARPGTVLLHRPLGLAALSAGVLLELAGLVWTVLLTRRAVR